MTEPDVAEPARTAAFERFARDAVDDMLGYQPALASELGDHRFDDRLEDLGPTATQDEIRALSGRLTALASLRGGGELPAAYRVDAEVLAVRLQDRLFDLEELRPSTWNPLIANPGTALYLLLARDFAPLPERLLSLAGRLGEVPERLAAARAGLSDMPRVHVETAIDQFGGTLRMVTRDIPAALQDAPELMPVVSPVIGPAVVAIETHLGWLRGQLGGAAGNPRLGPDRFARKLQLVLDVAMSPEEVLRRATEDLAAVEAELVEVAAEIGGDPRSVLARLGDDGPTDETIVELARGAMAEAVAFVREHALATIFEDPVEIIVMPEMHRGVAVAYCDAPGPLDPPGSTTFFAISPAPSSWPAERIRSFYREYNANMVRNLVVHEAMPGHVLQLAHGRRAAAVTKVRQAFTNGPFVEGWAVYAESVMAKAGFGGPGVRMQQLKMQLRTAINAILDVRVHCDDLSEREAMALMAERGYQEEGEAAGKWRRALLSSGQLATYHVGLVQIRDVAQRLGEQHPDWSTRRRHDELLAHGSPPPRHLPALFGWNS